ncbi:hypothetical protein EYZ11_010109 [Aspergillus tanneri]|uniref:GPI anchored cell wall protein n=1 Tax=Aspergillus tanneri TaxID=1220188 RepID=A0A4S3J6P1_9EURO|nr:uncharacterized protein ATNIH1004_011561 [Aspergillus tanneri]KAA8642616.1 hypothetical protein ATNIH1004_011561 [Aspergillus tanneri]THC90432.1 hypothetical protein EYZ11_010109 [Aspergillus tanneri]
MQFTIKTFLLACSLITAAAAAETTEIQMFYPDGEVTIAPHSLAASIINVHAGATTYQVKCVDDSDACELAVPATVTQGPSEFTMNAVVVTGAGGIKGTGTVQEACKITSSTQGASCSVSVGIEVSTLGVSTSTSWTTATSIDSDDITYRAVTVTADVNKLNSPQATEAAEAAGVAAGVQYGGAAAAAVIAAIGLL